MPAFRLLPCLLALALLAACKPSPSVKQPDSSTGGSADEPSPAATPGVPPFRFGLLLPLSGIQSSFGADAVKGAELAVEQINAAGGIHGKPLEAVIRDTRSEPTSTADLAQELASDDDIHFLIGEIASSRTLEAAQIAQATGKPLIAPAATLPEVTAVGNFIFRTCYADPHQGRAMAQLARSLEVTRAALLVESDNPYSTSLAASFRDAFTADGGTIVAEVSFLPEPGSLKSALDAVRAAKPEAVFLPSYYMEAAKVLREARASGLDMPFLGGDGWDSADFLAAAGSAAEDSYAANHFSHEEQAPNAVDFIEAFTLRFGEPPPPLAALTYDAIKLAAHALSTGTADQAADPSAIAASLAAITDYPGVTGRISLATDRTPLKPVVILRVEDGRFSYLETIPPPQQEIPSKPSDAPDALNLKTQEHRE